MSSANKEALVADQVTGCVPQLCRDFWMLADCRRRTKETLVGTSDATLDWTPPQGGKRIGSLLYHIALIELDEICNEALQLTESWPDVSVRLLL